MFIVDWGKKHETASLSEIQQYNANNLFVYGTLKMWTERIYCITMS